MASQKAISRLLLPLPTVSPGGDLYSGSVLSHPHVCVKCESKECKDRHLTHGPKPTEVVYGTCSQGWSTVSFQHNGQVTVVNGISVTDKGSNLPPAVKKAHHLHRYQASEVAAIINEYRERSDRLEKQMEDAVKKKYSLIHELQTAVNLVYRNIDPLLNHIAGDSLEEKIVQAHADIKPLLVSIKLLRSQMDMASVLASPESAAFGRRRVKPIYKIFHRTAKLFEQEAALVPVEISMRGVSYAAGRLHDSFDNIPLILLSNAVKYSTPGSRIVVEVEDQQDAIVASVTSRGPPIKPEELHQVFEQGFRGSAAKKASAPGSGLGLYIAQLIAEANEVTLQVQSQVDYPGGGVGTTTFFVIIHHLAHNPY